MNKTVSFATLFLLLAVHPASALASTFPDVPDGHLFQESVEELVRAGVINGNPDGTFKPEDNVNRAAMLKMLYLAEGKTPDPLSVRCFPDVEIGSWYEPYVCDAAARKYVNGYADGTFRPDSPVNRVEALKMIMTVFQIPLHEVNEANREIVNFADVSLSAWYTQYLLTAYNTQVLPIPGEQGAYFYPDNELSRGEAAAIIYNALHAELNAQRSQRSTSSSVSSSSSSVSQVADASESESSSSSSVPKDLIDVSYPFSKEGKFIEKMPMSYRFEITSVTTTKVEAKLQSGQQGMVTCRLYLLGESGFSDQYFLGFQEGTACHITATLNPGTYQLQLQPTNANTTYIASTTAVTGDGNDGFNNARALTVGAPRTDVLAGTDIADWYSFSVLSEQKMTVDITNPAEIGCIVYAMSDVDLQSFSGPQCNSNYTYPPGTYYISVFRKAPLGAQQTYTIDLQK